MFKTIPDVLTKQELEVLCGIAARTKFIDGRISAPNSPSKNNVVVGDMAILDRVAQIVADALFRDDTFRTFAFPKAMSPPILTKYETGMYYRTHVDEAFMLQASRTLRSDLSCTVFLSELDSYDGGELVARLGTSEVRLRAPAGAAVVYPSTMMHRVEEVTRGERLVTVMFIESRVADSEKRELLSELTDIGAITGEKMDVDTYTRLQRVQQNLMRQWGDPD